MCPVKTENQALNISREEAAFWRRISTNTQARSRGDFQKSMMLLGLERFDRAAAANLRAIRDQYKAVGPAKFMGAMALMAIFCLTLLNHEVLRRPACRVRQLEAQVQEVG